MAQSEFRDAVAVLQQAAHRHPEGSEGYYSVLEEGFRQLQSRFPGEDEVYAELLFVADHREGLAGERLARQILDWPASVEVKDKARGVLAKKAALGKPYRLALETVDGGAIRSEAFQGRVVVLDFWATWCPPCREMLPELKALFETFHDRGLEIVGISFDDDLETLRRFIKREGIGWAQVADGKGWKGPRSCEFGITSLPAMWILDRKGLLRDVNGRDGLAVKIERLLAE